MTCSVAYVPRSSNWEIELVAEDAGFSSKMERLFEEDLADAREVLLMKAGWRREVRPDRAIESTNRRARRGIVGSGMGSAGKDLTSAAVPRGDLSTPDGGRGSSGPR